MFRKGPKTKLPDLGGKPLGVWIQEAEQCGAMGHFKDLEGSGLMNLGSAEIYTTRDYWITAGMEPTKIFERYLGSDEKDITDIEEALRYLKDIIYKLVSDIKGQLEEHGTDLMLRKLLALFDATYTFYVRDRKSREKLSTHNADYSSKIYEENKNISLSILSGLNLVIENCILMQSKGINKNVKLNTQRFNDLVDTELLGQVYLYSLASQYYTYLNIAKNNVNDTYCSGLIVSPNKDIPIEGIIDHPLVYSSTLISGNLDSMEPENEEEYLSTANETEIGKGFKMNYGVEFLDVMGFFKILEDELFSDDIKRTVVVNEEELIKYLEDTFSASDVYKMLEHFTITKEKLQQCDSWIYKMGCNKHRLEIRPLMKLNNNNIYISHATLDRAIQLWFSYVINGGRPYTGVNPNSGDSLIDGCAKRESELSNILIDKLIDKLKIHRPNARFNEKDVRYHRVFGKREKDYGDFDIVYLVDGELFLIESKYLSDSYTANTVTGDHNKLFNAKKNYYASCRGRYDLVQRERKAMKDFLGVEGDIKVHYLFVSSKPLEIGLQDEDKVVTFLSVATFEAYLKGQLKNKDGKPLKTTHII